MSKCEYCGSEFVRRRPAKYCSEECRSKYYKTMKSLEKSNLDHQKRVCPTCNKEFISNAHNQIYCSSECYKPKKRKSDKRWADENREYKRASDRAYITKNKDTINKKRLLKNRENPEHIRKQQRDWVNSKPPEFKQKRSDYHTKWRYENRTLKMYKDAESRSKKRGLEFNIDIDDVIIPELCPLLGIPLYLDCKGVAKDNSPSLDRIDNSKGYIKGNVWVISHRANSIKRDSTCGELINIAIGLRKKFTEMKNAA